MSMRPLIYPVSSLEPIRKAMGSKDIGLLDRIVDGYKKLYKSKPDAESIQSLHDLGRSFVEGRLRGKKEPGEWQEVILLLACSLGLLQSKKPVNEDCKWMAYSYYYDKFRSRLSKDGRQLLRWLVQGRPFKGAAVASDGSYYAWLEQPEVEWLLAALRELEAGNPDVAAHDEGFHAELTDWLEACRGKALLLVAS